MKSVGTLFALIFAISFAFSQNITRVEPPNWWVGMSHNEIQIMVYGKDVADLKPTIEHPAMTLERVIQVQNPNYVFLEVIIDENASVATVPIQFYNNKKLVITHNYSLLDRDTDIHNQTGFDASDAIYLITPDRFANGSSKNDDIKGMKETANRDFKGGRHGGDIAGIVEHLDYIKDLGFTAIWLNPLLENDMKKYSYHGYSTTDYYKVDPRFGSNEEYQQLAATARQKGIKLIMDMIVNHCGLYHWWMDDLPTEDWINQWPTYTQTNHRKTILQDPYVSELDKKEFVDGWFVPTMPDLNQRNDLLGQYLIQNSIWWVEYLGLAGIRMDTYPYPDMDYMTDWTAAMMREYPNINIVGEEWNNDPAIVSYWQRNKENSNGYTSYLKSVMDFPVQVAAVKALTEEEAWGTGWITLYEQMAKDFLYPDPYNLVIFPDNHDMSRIFSQVNEDYDLFKQAIAFFLTTRGIPQIYYGTEILMKNPGTEDHGIIRSDFPGGWKKDKTNGFTNKGLSKQEIAAKEYLKTLLQWRKTATVVHTGKLMHFAPKDGVYVYFRYNDEQQVMVILNKNKEQTTLETNRFAERLKGITKGKDIITNQPYSLTYSITVPANSAVILELE